MMRMEMLWNIFANNFDQLQFTELNTTTELTNRSPPASLKIVNDNLTKERERMKKIMFGNSLMLLGIAIMILAGLKVIYVGTLWVSFLLIIVGFVMATIGFFGKDSK